MKNLNAYTFLKINLVFQITLMYMYKKIFIRVFSRLDDMMKIFILICCRFNGIVKIISLSCYYNG